eukprot:snap_masked-scaffold_3-processed-gene-15.42-mRNA-1 protein AED:1.00 eAED:1.00 QI:0/-1/0/0/-1/1/1/0/84
MESNSIPTSETGAMNLFAISDGVLEESGETRILDILFKVTSLDPLNTYDLCIESLFGFKSCKKAIVPKVIKPTLAVSGRIVRLC